VDRQTPFNRASRCMRTRYREALLAPSRQAVACPDDRKNRRGRLPRLRTPPSASWRGARRR
jgi:hypothetical protein